MLKVSKKLVAKVLTSFRLNIFPIVFLSSTILFALIFFQRSNRYFFQMPNRILLISLFLALVLQRHSNRTRTCNHLLTATMLQSSKHQKVVKYLVKPIPIHFKTISIVNNTVKTISSLFKMSAVCEPFCRLMSSSVYG